MKSTLSHLASGMKALGQYISLHIVPLVFSAVAISGSLYYFLNSRSETTVETVHAARTTISQYVRVTGSVVAGTDAALAFQAPGSVEFVGVKEGDVVPEGKVLATLSASDAQATLLQAEATLQNAQATLAQLVHGARPEELAVKQQVVDNASNALDQVYLTLPDTIRNVDVTTADVIKNKLSPLFVYAGNRYILSFTSCDQQQQSVVEQGRSEIENTLATFDKNSSAITTISSNDAIGASFEEAYKAIVATNQLVDSISTLLLASCSSGNTALDSYRATLSSVRATMTALFSDISTKRTALNTAKNTYAQGKRDLDLIKAGTDPYRISGQGALVKQAEAQVALAKAGLEKTKIIAPFAGTISSVSIVTGETVTAGKSVIGMLTTNAYQVETKISETDIVKIQVGSKVDMTLDAYGAGVILPGTVTRINPTATTEGNVPVYKVVVTFGARDPRVRPGMTANLSVLAQSKEALTLPARFVKVIDQGKGSVVIHTDKGDETKEIGLGIRGDGGLIEITSGLRESDSVLAPTTESRSAQKQTN